MSERYLLEQMGPDLGFYLRATAILAEARSAYQHIEIFSSPLFGRGMRIDGCFMTSEGDEFIYHECMAHVAALGHGRPRSALVVGGGDGGMARQLLAHRSMERVLMLELDAEVVRLAREWLPNIHRGAFEDPRLEVRIGDGKAFVETAGEGFDQIILDLTDPFGPAQALYTADFYRACRARLNPGGVLSLHLESPVHRPVAMRRILASLQAVFPLVRPYLVHIPLYGTCWAMATASLSVDPARLPEDEVERRIRAQGLEALRYYNGAVHRALFALPNYVRDLLARPAEPVRLGEALPDVPDPARLPRLHVASS